MTSGGYRGCYFGFYDSLKPMLLGEDAGLFLSFCLGYGVTVTSGLISYPIDTIRRRMMMTSGQAVKYKGSIDCTAQILKNEGFMSLMKGAGANILRGVAGAGVLAGFDKFKEVYIGMRKKQLGLAWCCWCRCVGRFRQIQGGLHRNEEETTRTCVVVYLSMILEELCGQIGSNV